MIVVKHVLNKFGLYLALATFALPLLPLLVFADQSSINVWWPTDGAHVSGTQPFKAQLMGLDPSQYQMFWQVDGGNLNPMSENDTDYPHMEAAVDLSGWNWHGSGPYTVTFVAQQNGQTIGQQQETIYVDGNNTAPAAVVADQQTGTSLSATTTTPQSQSTQNQSMITAPPPITVSAPTVIMSSVAPINAWWPTTDAHISGVQPFKALLSGVSLDQYQMFWQVDGGQLNLMQDSTTDSPHKEASVDVSGWNWQPSGVYTVTFVAKDLQGNTIAQISEPVLIGNNAQPQAQSSQASQTADAQTVQTINGMVVRLSQPNVQMTAAAFASSAKSTLYVNPDSEAAQQAASWGVSTPNGEAMETLANQPTAVWFGNWNSNVQSDVNKVVTAAAAAGATPVLVAYNIPQRDCGGFSSGGSDNPAGYQQWIQQFAQGIGSNNAIVILEPDALAQISCLSSSDQATRMQLLSSAISTLKVNPNTKVYIDAGHSNWIDAGTMAGELQQAGVQNADGFSLNVSNFNTTSDEINYGEQLSSKLDGKHFVVDTSRNGNGSNGQWCNPSGMAIGQTPTLNTGNSLVDAFLWIKTPGESDGTCNGGPSAGVWWPSYALSLVQNAH